MTLSSTSTPGLNQKAQSASPQLVRATSPAKSRLTVRLPDLSSARIQAPAAPIANAGSSMESNDRVAPSSGELTENAGNGATAQNTLAYSPALAIAHLQALSRKTLEFVRQPKFWLACIVAVAVQIVLAFAMTPADAGREGEKRSLAPAKPWPKAAEEPADRIVVPAAPANVNEERPETLPTGASPMGPTLRQEPSNEPRPPGSTSLSEPGAGDRLSSARMAENRPLADESRRFDGQLDGAADGATLGGIAPVEPGLPLQKQGQP